MGQDLDTCEDTPEKTARPALKETGHSVIVVREERPAEHPRERISVTTRVRDDGTIVATRVIPSFEPLITEPW